MTVGTVLADRNPGACEQYASSSPRILQGGAPRKPRLTWDNVVGAGEGNRTPVPSLGSSCSTIELHPRERRNGTRSTASPATRRQRLTAVRELRPTRPDPGTPCRRRHR